MIDFHTHLYPKDYELSLHGIDDLLNYHYLIAEYFRVENKVDPNLFFKLSKEKRSEYIWNALFYKKILFSESVRGVDTVLNYIDYYSNNLTYKELKELSYDKLSEDEIFSISGIDKVIMTNDISNENEIKFFSKNRYERYLPSLRLDTMKDLDEIKIQEAIQKLKPLYLSMSLSNLDNITKINKAANIAKLNNIPLSLMIGVKRNTNELLKDAGDSVSYYSLNPLEKIVKDNPDTLFCVTVLSDSTQYQLSVIARKFNNLIPFGIWWFLNNDSYILDITNMRINLLGNTFIPQHSDARILEQLIYKWKHTHYIIDPFLKKKFQMNSKEIKEFFEYKVNEVLGIK